MFGLDINYLIATIGVSGTMTIIVAFIVYRITKSATKRADAETETKAKNKEADVEQQRVFTKMAVGNNKQISDLQGIVNSLHVEIGSLKDQIIEMTKQRTVDREQYVELKVNYDNMQRLHSIELGLVKDQLGRMVSQYETDLKVVADERDRYRKERDTLRNEISKLNLEVTRLTTLNGAYREQSDSIKLEKPSANGSTAQTEVPVATETSPIDPINQSNENIKDSA